MSEWSSRPPCSPARSVSPWRADNAPALSGDIFRLDANGRLVNLSNSPFADEHPLVSDGRRVAFVGERGGGPGIYEVGIDGAGLRRLDPPPHQIGASLLTPQLAWSPDGRLVTVRSQPGSARVELAFTLKGQLALADPRDRNGGLIEAPPVRDGRHLTKNIEAYAASWR